MLGGLLPAGTQSNEGPSGHHVILQGEKRLAFQRDGLDNQEKNERNRGW